MLLRSLRYRVLVLEKQCAESFLVPLHSGTRRGGYLLRQCATDVYNVLAVRIDKEADQDDRPLCFMVS